MEHFYGSEIDIEGTYYTLKELELRCLFNLEHGRRQDSCERCEIANICPYVGE